MNKTSSAPVDSTCTGHQAIEGVMPSALEKEAIALRELDKTVGSVNLKEFFLAVAPSLQKSLRKDEATDYSLKFLAIMRRMPTLASELQHKEDKIKPIRDRMASGLRYRIAQQRIEKDFRAEHQDSLRSAYRLLEELGLLRTDEDMTA